MSKLKKPIPLETAFGSYLVDEILGQGGAGIVYGGLSLDDSPVAIKVLTSDSATADKRKRFKNEIGFLAKNRHPNIVAVTDYGLAKDNAISGPFYVMPRFQSSLRHLIKRNLQPANVLRLFSQILDGIEAAHLQDVVHRDIKPENILCDSGGNSLVVADFGIARFTEDMLVTSVETRESQRMANFQYAAPEQRSPGQQVGHTADIYALGLLLNEMFTSAVPTGTEFRKIVEFSKAHEYLDDVVAKMLRQSPNQRPSSIAEVKALIRRHEADAVSLQRLSSLNGTVIRASEIDDPLALAPPSLVDARWDGSKLVLTLDRAVTPGWVQALRSMGSYSSVLGHPPESFGFNENQASSDCADFEVQPMVDQFKNWLPMATIHYAQRLQDQAERAERDDCERLRREREAEEKLRVINQNIRI
jgi:serine/threonine protein kinase